MNGTRGLVVVTRAPGSDGAKTRLAEAIGADACLRLQAAFLADTVHWGGPSPGVGSCPSILRPACARSPSGGRVAVAPQLGEDFGERMRGAVNAGFAAGAAPVAMIASDSPTLPPEVLEEGWSLVEGGRSDVALGPAEDGGWVMIAAARPLPPACFADVRWSGPETLDDTRRALSAAGLRVACTRSWYDVDTAADLERLRAELGAGAAPAAPHRCRDETFSRIGWTPRSMTILSPAVLRLMLGALFFSTFFENLEKNLYTVSGYSGSSTTTRRATTLLLLERPLHEVHLRPRVVLCSVQAVFELSLGILLVLGLASGVVALVAAAHLTALWVSELGILWVWELLSLIVVAVVVGLAFLPALLDRARPVAIASSARRCWAP